MRGIEATLLEQVQQLLQLLFRQRPSRRLQQPAGIEAALQRALQPAKVDAEHRLPQDASELIGASGRQRLRQR